MLTLEVVTNLVREDIRVRPVHKPVRVALARTWKTGQAECKIAAVQVCREEVGDVTTYVRALSTKERAEPIENGIRVGGVLYAYAIEDEGIRVG